MKLWDGSYLSTKGVRAVSVQDGKLFVTYETQAAPPIALPNETETWWETTQPEPVAKYWWLFGLSPIEYREGWGTVDKRNPDYDVAISQIEAFAKEAGL